MADNDEIRWLAGLLEGEGSFSVGRHHAPNGRVYAQPKISLVMTDEDVIRRAATVMGATVYPPRLLPSGKHAWRTVVYGRRCIGWAQTLYGLMGARRQQQISLILTAWHEAPIGTRRPVHGGVPSLTT